MFKTRIYVDTSVIGGCFDDEFEEYSNNEESIQLANSYLTDGVIAESSLSDARHIAIATIERVDILVSWNFKHIVNINRIHLLNSIYISDRGWAGYKTNTKLRRKEKVYGKEKNERREIRQSR